MRVAVAACLALAIVAPAGADAPDVRWDGDRVSARFDAVPLGDALEALARATGAELRGAVATPHGVTLTLDAVPIEEALARLLAGQSYTVRYGEGGRVKAILLGGTVGVRTAPPPRSPAAGVASAPSGPVFPLVLGKMFDSHRPLDVPDALAARLGEKQLGMPRLLEIAVVDDDGVSRALASNVVLSALEHEARYRRSFLRTLHRLEPAELAAIADGPSGERFEELLEFLAAHSREPTLQKKAGVVLDQMRAAAG
jgi:hypothetical protein